MSLWWRKGGYYGKVKVKFKLTFMFYLFYNDVCDYNFRQWFKNLVTGKEKRKCYLMSLFIWVIYIYNKYFKPFFLKFRALIFSIQRLSTQVSKLSMHGNNIFEFIKYPNLEIM